MNDMLDALLKISLVVFMAGNLLDMGLRLQMQDALAGLRNRRFVVLTLLWCFVLSPLAAYALIQILPLEAHYALGLMLLGMTPCAPFLPAMVSKAQGDMGYTASFMLLASVGTVIFMPIAVPFVAHGLSVSAWAIAKPLIIVVLLPLALGMWILQRNADFAARLQVWVKRAAGLATLIMVVLLVVIYGKSFVNAAGSFAVGSQVLYLGLITACSYVLAFGLPPAQRSVLSLGICTRNLGAALAPLFAAADSDDRALVMVMLGIPVQVILAALAARYFAARTKRASVV